MSVAFNKHFQTVQSPIFDSRAFSIPWNEVTNAFLWRAKDWERNSLQMYARAFFSHKQLHGKGKMDMHDMLHGIGKNWTTDLTDQEKNGTFIIASNDGLIVRSDIKPNYQDIYSAIGHLFIYPD